MVWPRYYGISAEALQSFSVPEAGKLAKAVLGLGPDFSHHRNHPELSEEKIKSICDLARLVLKKDSLMASERMWAFGIFSYLRQQIPADKNQSIPTIWQEKDMRRPREEFLSFFLRDVNVEKLLQEMWSGFPSQVEPGSRVIQEAIQRESTIHLIKNEMKAHHPKTDFQKILLDFMNLKTPINSEKAASLFRTIGRHLIQQIQQKEISSDFDEIKNRIRLMLHLEEYDDTSSAIFQTLMKDRRPWWQIIFQTDIGFQLEDKSLLPEFKKILNDFANTVELNESQLSTVLGILHHQPTSSSQLARFFRVVNLVLQESSGIYESLNLTLNQYPEMISNLSEFSLKHGLGNVSPHWHSRDLRYFIFRKQEDQMASIFRDRLARNLIHQGVLSQDETGWGLKEMEWNFCGSRKKSVTQTLHIIFKKILDMPGKTGKNPHLMEYILYLISLKNNDAMLYRHLLMKETLVFKKLVVKVSKFSQDPSWNEKSTLDEFETALDGLEKVLMHVATATETAMG